MRLLILIAIIINGLTLSPSFGQNTPQTESKEDQRKEKPPGIIGGLKEIVGQTRSNIQKTFQNLRSSQKTELNPSQELIQKSEIDPEFLRSIFLYSDKRYIQMINLNECHLYALLENQLLKSAMGKIDFLIMKSETQGQYLVRYDQYVSHVYKYKCQSFAQYSNIFSNRNLKRTVLSIPYPVPKTEKECKKIIEDWKKNDYLPYLCKIPNILEEGKKAKDLLTRRPNAPAEVRRNARQSLNIADQYIKEIPFFERSYLVNLCKSVEGEQYFCDPYLSTDAWSKMINGEIDNHPLSFMCNALLNQPAEKKLTEAQLAMCATKLKKEPEACLTKTTDGYLSIFPRPNCSQISLGLINGRLHTPFHDCPGQVENGGITNLHRILGHFKDHDVNSSIDSCNAEATYTYSQFMKNAKRDDVWPLKVCYYDRIESKEICYSYLPGNLAKSDMSEDKMLSKILYKMGKISSRQSCKIITKKEYRPILLEYKSGCFAVFDEDNCSNQYCPKQIIIDEEPVEGITYRGFIEFDYFPNDWSTRKKSIAATLESVYKVVPTKILNLTRLELFLNQNKDAIIHGMGCAEDIIPQYKQRRSFNQCSPTPFIIDGMFEKEENKILSVRTAYDDNLSPRLVPWNWIFTAVLKYQALHPLNQWNLFGLKQSQKPVFNVPYAGPPGGAGGSGSSSSNSSNSNKPLIQIPTFNTGQSQGGSNGQTPSNIFGGSSNSTPPQ